MIAIKFCINLKINVHYVLIMLKSYTRFNIEYFYFPNY